MEELLQRLEETDFSALDIDEVLDSRDDDAFDDQWSRVYGEIEALKPPCSDPHQNRDLRERAFRIVYRRSGSAELAGYLSDDFGLIADSMALGYSDRWLDRLIGCYQAGTVPFGEL